jgi:hypothetical protein
MRWKRATIARKREYFSALTLMSSMLFWSAGGVAVEATTRGVLVENIAVPMSSAG